MIITITGKNDFMASAELKELTGEFVSKFGDSTLRYFDAKETDSGQLSEAVLSQPFLARKSLVVLKNIGEAKDLHDTLSDLVDKVPDSTDLIVYDPNIDRRTSIYKTLKNKTEFKDFSEPDERELIEWVIKQFEPGMKINREVARHLVGRTGENQWRLASEIEKLKNFEEPITRELIDSAVEQHPRETIFELLDAIGAKDRMKALKIYESLINARTDPGYILSMLIWQLHNMSIIAAAGNRPDAQIASDMGINPYVLRKTRKAAAGMDSKDIRAMWVQILNVDEKIKSSSVDDEQLVEQLIVKLSS